MKYMKKYIWNILIAIDQFANAILAGDPDETISSRCQRYKERGEGWAKHLSAFLALFEKDHTEKSVERDEGDDEVWK